MKILHLVLLLDSLLAVFHSSVYAGDLNDACRTANNTEGVCKLINDCSLIKDMVTLKVKSAEVQRYLRGSSCGTRVGRLPVVCCHTGLGTRTPEQSHCNMHLINDEVCGHSTADRIFNGVEASLGEFPWMALLLYEEKGAKELKGKCGGSLISKKYVLTAAHCIIPGLKKVRLGEHNIITNPDCEDVYGGNRVCSPNPQEIVVKSTKKHNRYNRNTITNDIALIQLKTPATIDDNVRTICLPLQERSANVIKMDVSGWGVTESNRSSDVLMKATVPMMSHSDCRAAFASFGAHVQLSEAQLCAGGDQTMLQADSCNGDSGGPLQTFLGQQMVQYGLVSFGPRRCATPGVPAVYTNVLHYMPWILDNIGQCQNTN